MKNLFTPLLFIAFLINAYPAWVYGNDMFSFSVYEYNWQEKRNLIPLTENEKKQSAIIQKYRYALDYFYDEDNNLRMRELVHKIIRLNDNQSIHQHNKVVIPMENAHLIKIRGRSINSSGKITELKTENIKNISYSSGNHKIFAFEGVEEGSEIEYYYVIEKAFEESEHIVLQTSIPTKKLEFRITSPDNLVFEIKNYNGLPDPVYIQNDDVNVAYIKTDFLPALKPKTSFLYEAHLAALQYKLSYNDHQTSQALNTWQDISNRLCVSIYEEYDEKTVEKLNGLFQEIMSEWHQKASEEEKIVFIDYYIKKHIRQVSLAGQQDLDAILQNKYASSLGIIKLYAALFEIANIRHQFVFTSDRTVCSFDKDFSTWDLVHNFLFYFPNQNTYLTPNEENMPYNVVPYMYVDNEGIFVRKTKKGDYTFAQIEFKTIEPTHVDKNSTQTHYQVNFDKDLKFAEVAVDRAYTGYKAIAAEEMKAIQEDFGSEITSVASNPPVPVESESNEYQNSLKLHNFIRSQSLIEKASDRFLFRVGDLIAPHPRYYFPDEERKEDIEHLYAQSYKTVVEFRIPDGYFVRNLEDLRYNEFIKEGEEKTAGFSTDYFLVDKTVYIEITEYYHKSKYDKSLYEKHKKVSDASLSFRQVALVLEKTN